MYKRFLLALTFLTISGLIACSGGGSSNNNNGGDGGGTTPSLTSISITPIGPAVNPATGPTVQFTATGTFSDNSTKDLTQSAKWGSSNPTIGTINSTGLATGVAVGIVKITATSGSVSGSTALNVTNLALTNATLKDRYAFLVKGVDSKGPTFNAGTVVFDGNGNITGGTADLTSSSGASNAATASGTYSVFLDGRGQMNLKLGSQTTTYRFIVSKDGTEAKLIEFDTTGNSAGVLEKQAATTFSGKYVFQLGGFSDFTASTHYFGQVGVLNTGSSVSGQADTYDNGAIGANQAVTGTTTTPDTTGRGTAAITVNGKTRNFAVYVASSSKAYLVETDAQPGSIGGVAEKQTSTAGPGAVTFVIHLDHAANPTAGTFEKTGQLSFDGSGGLAAGAVINEDQKDETVHVASAAGVVGATDASGRGTITYTSDASTLSTRNLVFYVVDSAKWYVLETTPMARGSIGLAEQQSTATALLAPGPYSFTATELGEGNVLMVGQLSVDAQGNISAIQDKKKTTGELVSVALTSTAPLAVNSNIGTVTLPNSGTSSWVMYLISNQAATFLGVAPDVDGRIDQQ